MTRRSATRTSSNRRASGGVRSGRLLSVTVGASPPPAPDFESTATQYFGNATEAIWTDSSEPFGGVVENVSTFVVISATVEALVGTTGTVTAVSSASTIVIVQDVQDQGALAVGDTIGVFY